MNILTVNKFYWRKGGSESVFFGEKDLLEKGGHQVIPFAMKSAQNEETPYSSFFVEEVDYSAPGVVNKVLSASKIIYSFDAHSKIATLLSEVDVDVAHFHIFQHQISPSVFGPLRKKGIPIVLTLHDLKPLCPNYKMLVNGRVCEACKGRKFYNCTVNRCTKGALFGSLVNTVEMYFHYLMGYYQSVDQYIAPSRFMRDKFIEFGFPEEQITYLPNFIDVSQFDGENRDERYVLYFGRLSEEKGLQTLIRAASMTPEVRYLIVGDGPLRKELEYSVENQGLENVSFLGFKTGQELKRLLTESSFVVIPSECYENCPMTVLESFASGKPVIGTDIGGIPELIDHGEDGWVVPVSDPEALAHHIRLLWDDSTRAREMGRTGREKMRQRFSPEEHLCGLLSVYGLVGAR